MQSLLSDHRPGFCLPRPFYVDPAVFEQEFDRIFTRVWLFAGHVNDIPRRGDYFRYDIAGESLIILRSDADTIHAHFNVCRHRGSQICLESAGHVKKLVCPYHAWTYDLDGSLIAARHMGEPFDRSSYGLHPCAVQVVEGLIFLCLGDDPPDFVPLAADIRRLFKPHGFASAKVAHRETFRMRCNWKIAAENTWECYHCPASHPEYCAVMATATAKVAGRQSATHADVLRAWEDRARQLGHLVLDKDGPGQAPFIHRGPIGPGFVTQSRDGQRLAPLMGDFRAYDGGITALQTYPIIWFAACNDFGLLVRFTPLSHLETEAQYTWVVHSDAVEGTDYDLDRLTWLWRITGEQDKRICEDNQAGVNSRRFTPGPYSADEQLVEGFVRWYLNQMGAARE